MHDFCGMVPSTSFSSFCSPCHSLLSHTCSNTLVVPCQCRAGWICPVLLLPPPLLASIPSNTPLHLLCWHASSSCVIDMRGRILANFTVMNSHANATTGRHSTSQTGTFHPRTGRCEVRRYIGQMRYSPWLVPARGNRDVAESRLTTPQFMSRAAGGISFLFG